MTEADHLAEIRDAWEIDQAAWEPIRREGKTDMEYVAGRPFDQADMKARKNRPTVAPDELAQYRNAVINSLMANPRGAKFAPTGSTASQKGAQFYAKKWREVEYRSKAPRAYAQAADNALQRSYGFVRVTTKYGASRSANQELWIEGFPNPDMVLPDSRAIAPDLSDAKRCFVYQWFDQRDFKRQYPSARIVGGFGDAVRAAHWVQGQRVRVAEYWYLSTRPRRLLLVAVPPRGPQGLPPGRPAPPMLGPAGAMIRPPNGGGYPPPGLPGLPPGMPPPPGMGMAPAPPRPEFKQLFLDELDKVPGAQVVRELRVVDYPTVKMCLTNGVEILHEQDWPGKYIPIVSCFGKVFYTEGADGMRREIFSMTRAGRDPWKAYCYACSQELEILGQVPKGSVLAAAGQLAGFEKEWEESQFTPKAVLFYRALTEETGERVLPPPQRLAYTQGDNLQAIELVKEGFRRAIQAAMGSSFLPTQAQRRNEKSGVALDKIEQMAAQGTYHFVYAYEDLIRQCACIGEDLMDQIYDYAGTVGVLAADGEAESITINSPGVEESVDTAGDYLVTISTAPSSDSEQENAKEFTDQLVGQIERIASVSGPKVAAAILSKSVKMRNLGPVGDQLADLIEPQEFKQKGPDGQPPDPRLAAAQAQIQQLTQLLQRAAQEKQAKVVEQQGKFAIASMQEQAESARNREDNEVKLAVAELSAKVERLALFLEESRLIGARRHEAIETGLDRQHEAEQAERDRALELAAAAQAQRYALDTTAQAQAYEGEAAARDRGYAVEDAAQARGEALEDADRERGFAMDDAARERGFAIEDAMAAQAGGPEGPPDYRAAFAELGPAGR